ncbi:putative lipid phosphate phosphatase 4 [Apium graveolens]|uniref:putative lipid phosphate phosphatase 4 n=1 Tax=Apium graveolens TaxID=4045 RepID=UPI003D7A47A3
MNSSPKVFMNMSDSQHGANSYVLKLVRRHRHDWLTLVLLGLIDGLLNLIEPFHRYLSEEMLTPDIKYPYHHDTIPMWSVPIYAYLLPILLFLLYYYVRRDPHDLHYAVLGVLYSGIITGVITDTIKDAVGRPRPNFFFRCFPDGMTAFKENGDVLCHGDSKIIKEGYKSFPSGHSSWSFAGLGFLGLYLSGKIRAFDRRGHAAKLCIVILPYLLAALVGVSRVDDYWHHWTDVFSGALLGIIVSTTCYLLLFPFPHAINCWAPHAYFIMLEESASSSRDEEV